MISDENLAQLRYKGESADLDFKQAQYPFGGASDHQKSELLKDILAMANAYRAGPGYILIGFRDNTPHPAEVVGLTAADHIDDAALQQLVCSKIDPLLEFQYEEQIFHGNHVAIITIPKQARPFAPKHDYGKLKKNAVYVRRGSSTDEASMSEMSKMALADAGSSKIARIELQIYNENNEPLPSKVALTFIEFGELLDYEEDAWNDIGSGLAMRIPSMRIVNRHYYRECAEYFATLQRTVKVRLSLVNQSEFGLGEVKLELSCSAPKGEYVKMLRSDNLPDFPSSGDHLHLMRGVRNVVEQLRERVSIDERGSVPVCHVILGALRPGETGISESDIAALPSGPGDYTFKVRILANEISKPIVQEHRITIEGDVMSINHGGLMSLLYSRERLDLGN